jgi:hypothetical protein
MSLFNIHREFSDQEPPVRIPDVETSWKQMEASLNNDMPLNKVYGRFIFFGKEHVRSLLLIIGLLLAVLTVNH